MKNQKHSREETKSQQEQVPEGSTQHPPKKLVDSVGFRAVSLQEDDLIIVLVLYMQILVISFPTCFSITSKRSCGLSWADVIMPFAQTKS